MVYINAQYMTMYI